MPSRVGRLWRDLPMPARRALRGYMRDLVARYGPLSDKVAWEHAQRVCEAWLTASTTSREATGDAARRQHGAGRRPARKDVSRSLKRAGLQAMTHERLLVRLEMLTKRPAGTLRTLLGAAEGTRR